MMRSFVTAVAIGLPGVLGILGPHPKMLAAQEMQLAMRGPRFYQAPSAKGAPVEIDVRSSSLLRTSISLNFERATVGDVLGAIEKQTGVTFIYSRRVVAVDRPVRVRAERITVAGALTEILVDAGIDVLLKGNQLALVARPHLAVRRTGTITGRIADAKTRLPVADVEVRLEGTRWRTSTDTGGRYRLVEVDSGTYTLTVRRVGYAKQSQQVAVHDALEQTVDLWLAPVAVTLDELVTTATGTVRRRDLGNAITTINADSVIQTAPIRNLTDLLENRVPGLTMQRTSGAPGDPTRYRLRGIGSVLRGNDPVVIVDGVRIYSNQSEARSGNLTTLINPTGNDPHFVNPGTVPAPSPLDQIDPNIIEKIEVFKGPSAATLYGADAANGVIVITTKKGRPGPTRWNATVSHGRTSTPGQWPEGYFRWGSSALNGDRDLVCSLSILDCVQDSLVRFQALNEPDLTLLGEGRRSAVSVTASGGSQTLIYSVTGTYGDEVGLLQLPEFEATRFRSRFSREAPEWMRRPHHLKDWSVKSNVTARLGSTAEIVLSNGISRVEQQRSSLERELNSFAGLYVDEVNGFYYTPRDFGNGRFRMDIVDNLLGAYYIKTTASSIAITTGLNAKWQPRSWLDLSGQAGIDLIPRDDAAFLEAGLVTPADSGVLVHGSGRSVVGTVNFQGKVRKSLGRGFVFETSAGTNIVTQRTDDIVTSGVGLIPGTSSFNGARSLNSRELRTNTSVFGWYVEPRLVGERLSLSTGLRIDGGNTYGTRIGQSGGLGQLLSLPKLNGSWVISEEPFFPFRGLFSSLRLRAAYGQAQVQPGPQDRLRLYRSQTDPVGQWLNLTKVGNTELRPERSVEFEGGVDADLLDSRISLELTAYRKTQVDAHMAVGLPLSVNGGGSVIQNVGNIRNTGVEVTLGFTPIRIPAVTWNAQLQYSKNANTLVKLGRGVVPNKREGLVEGYPVRGRWARPILGYSDQNSNGILEYDEVQVGDSLVYMGRLQPDYTTSLFTNIALLNGTIGITAGFRYESGAVQIEEAAQTNWVFLRGLADPGASLGAQAAVLTSTFPRSSDPKFTEYGVMQDVSTLRFNSFAINYRAPGTIARLVRAQTLTLAVQGANLGFLHTTYRGKDPNVNTWGAGEKIHDAGQLPLPRTWQLSLYLQY